MAYGMFTMILGWGSALSYVLISIQLQEKSRYVFIPSISNSIPACFNIITGYLKFWFHIHELLC